MDESRRRCNAISRMTSAIHMMTPKTLGLKVLLAARIPVEEHMIAVSTIASCLATHKMSCQLIVLSRRMLSPVVLAERHPSRNSRKKLVSLVRIPFLTARGSVRRSWTAVISVNHSVIPGTVILAQQSWKLIVAVAESHLRRCVTEQKSSTPCASRPVRQTGIVEDIVVASTVVLARRRLLSGLLNRRSNVLAPTHCPLKLSTYASRLVVDH